MSPELIGVIVGGLIGILPSIVAGIVQARCQLKEHNHTLKLKEIEVCSEARIKALLDYAARVGALSSFDLDKEFDLDKYFASAEKAACFVKPTTRKLIFQANEHAKNWYNQHDVNGLSDIQERLSSALQDEISSTFDQDDNPTCRRKRKKHE